jgi:hypothetical protein
MAPEKNFCANCGNPLEEGDKFCAYCGNPLSGVESTPQSALSTPPPAPPSQSPVAPGQMAAPAPAAQPDQEKVIGVIPVSRKKSLFSFESFSLVVTERRMIFALMTKEIMKEQAAQLYSKGFLKGLGNLVTQSSGNNYIAQRYLNKPPEEALKENPQNFAIDRSSIKKIKLAAGFIGVGGQDAAEGKLEIQSMGEKLSFIVKQNDYSTAREVFKRAEISG